jgi:hypothetical protein
MEELLVKCGGSFLRKSRACNSYPRFYDTGYYFYMDRGICLTLIKIRSNENRYNNED